MFVGTRHVSSYTNWQVCTGHTAPICMHKLCARVIQHHAVQVTGSRFKGRGGIFFLSLKSATSAGN